jgi:hypothetical protein
LSSEAQCNEHCAQAAAGTAPKTESVKLTFVLSGQPQDALDRYAELHAETYGEAVDATTLIPLMHMLEAFMVGDRGFGLKQEPAQG